MPVGRSIRAVGAASVLAVAAVSMLLTMQGWQSRVPAFHLLTYDYTARAFLETGAIPSHGAPGAMGPSHLPGTAWLMMPGIVLLGDPRLSDRRHGAPPRRGAGGESSSWAHATSVGPWGSPARCSTDYRPTVVPCGLLWPNGRRTSSSCSSCSSTPGSIGAVLDPRRRARRAHARVVRRPRARPCLSCLWSGSSTGHRSARSLLVAAAIVGVTWSPYLLLQVERGFADLRSRLLLQDIVPADYRSAWCGPERQISDVLGPQSRGRLGRVRRTGRRGDRRRHGSRGPGVIELRHGSLGLAAALGALLGLATAATVLTLQHLGSRRHKSGAPAHASLQCHRDRSRRSRLDPASAGDRGRGHPGDRGSGFRSQSRPRAGDLGRSDRRAAVARVGGRSCVRTGRHHHPDPRARAARRVLVLSLLVPWLIVVIVAEPGKPERFWWLWPLRVLFLAALAFDLLPRLAPRWIASLVAVALAAFILVNPMTVQRLDSWARTGWAGNDAPEVQVVDAIGSVAAASGRDRVAVGYETFVYWFMAAYHITDPTYKVGAEFDLLLADRHGVVNTNACAEGLSPADEFRVVQTRRKPGVGGRASISRPLVPPGSSVSGPLIASSCGCAVAGLVLSEPRDDSARSSNGPHREANRH